MNIDKQEFDKIQKKNKRDLAEREIDIKRMMGVLASLLDLFSDTKSPEDLTWALESVSEACTDTIIARCAEGSSILELFELKYMFETE